MTDAVSLHQTLESLRRKRGSKRGSLSKLKRKASEFRSKSLNDMSPEVPDDHLEELAAIKSAHTMIQDQIDELILGLDDMIEAEEPEKDKDVEAQASIRYVDP